MSREQNESGKRFYDITHPISPQLAVWTGDTPFALHTVAKISRGSSVNLGAVTMSLHTGTHADAPYHYSDKGETMEALSPEIYVGAAQVVDVTGFDLITIEVLENAAETVGVGQVERLLLKTGGWNATTVFPEHIPVLAENVPDYLNEKGIFLLGVDVPSVDQIDSKTLPIHHALGENGIHILESLRLEDVPPGLYELIALPLPLAGADGCPVRAVLR